MGKCPFLSTDDERVQCFKECVFYKCSDFDGKCPFKQIQRPIQFKLADQSDYHNMMYDNNSPLSILYK